MPCTVFHSTRRKLCVVDDIRSSSSWGEKNQHPDLTHLDLDLHRCVCRTCMSTLVHTYLHTYVFVYTSIYHQVYPDVQMYAHTHLQRSQYVCVCLYISTSVPMYTCMSIHIYIHPDLDMHAYTYLHVSRCIHVCLYISTQIFPYLESFFFQKSFVTEVNAQLHTSPPTCLLEADRRRGHRRRLHTKPEIFGARGQLYRGPRWETLGLLVLGFLGLVEHLILVAALLPPQ